MSRDKERGRPSGGNGRPEDGHPWGMASPSGIVSPHTYIHRDHEPSAWLRGAIRKTLRGAHRCSHLPYGLPGFAALWRPGLIACTSCAETFQLHGSADHVCDRCRRISYDKLNALALPLRDALLFGGLCPNCWQLEVPA